MNPSTHLVINWSLARSSGQEYPLSAVSLGSVSPDMPLCLLSFVDAAYHGLGKGMVVGEVAQKIWGDLYFNDPWWIAIHNVLRSPLMVAALLGVLWLRLGRSDFFGSWWTWFLMSCFFHSLVDIPVHHNDGPLLLWPLNQSLRFNSPVSYWRPGHYGVPCMIFEACLLVWPAARLAWPRVAGWFATAWPFD